MSHLKAVPKPVGHDVVARRVEQDLDTATWLPENVLYDVSEHLKERGPTKAMIIAWYRPDEETGFALEYSLYCEKTNDGTALAADLFHQIVSGGGGDDGDDED